MNHTRWFVTFHTACCQHLVGLICENCLLLMHPTPLESRQMFWWIIINKAVFETSDCLNKMCIYLVMEFATKIIILIVTPFLGPPTLVQHLLWYGEVPSPLTIPTTSMFWSIGAKRWQIIVVNVCHLMKNSNVVGAKAQTNVRSRRNVETMHLPGLIETKLVQILKWPHFYPC